MSARFKTKLHTFSGSGETLQAIFSAQGLLADDYVGAFTVRAHRDNLGDVTWSDTDGSAGGFLSSGESASVELDGKFVRAPEIQFLGTAGDKAYFTYLAP
jgi:hypothetical protein